MHRGPGRAERACLGLFLLFSLGLYVWAAHYRLDALDEGYFISASWRVLAGDLPYRDFSTPYTPAFFYLNASCSESAGWTCSPCAARSSSPGWGCCC